VTIETKLLGDARHVVVCQLGPGQCVYAEAGRFLWKTENVGVATRVSKFPAATTAAPPSGGAQPPAAGGNRFLHRALATASEVSKRMLPGESVAVQRYTANGDGLVAFAGLVPGAARVVELDGTAGWYVEKDAFIAAESTVDFQVVFSGVRTGRRLVADALVLQRYRGSGTLVVAGAGDLIELNPARYGGRVQVDTGCLVAFEDTLDFRLERLGGIEGAGPLSGLPGTEAIAVATVEGDGNILLQSLSLDGMAIAIARRAAREERQNNGGGFFATGHE
jgi:uncharacterized protein (AIM24 family)